MSDRIKQKMERLVSLARKAPPAVTSAEESALQPGFATRVAARWAASRDRGGMPQLWERLCWRGAAVATLLCLASFLYTRQTPQPTAFEILMGAPAASNQSEFP
jgi:hypothetical protein